MVACGSCGCVARPRAGGFAPPHRSTHRRQGEQFPSAPTARAPRLATAGLLDLLFKVQHSEVSRGRDSPASKVTPLPCGDGTSSHAQLESAGDDGSNLLFAAFSTPQPGTRPIALQGCHFHAFTSARCGATEVVVWRRLGDAINARYGPLQDGCQFWLAPLRAGESRHPGRLGTQKEGPLADLYSRRAFNRNHWIYWESFWAPIDGRARALVSGGDGGVVVDEDFAPLLALPRDATAATAKPAAARQSSPAWSADEVSSGEKAQAFAAIYRRAVWPGVFSKSGPGSDPFHPMARLAITALDAVVDELGIRSILDAACGDAAWLVSGFLARRSEVTYIGLDIVAHVIEENRLRHPDLHFICADLGTEHPAPGAGGLGQAVTENDAALPQVDLVFSKETFNHMFVQDAAHAIARLRRTGSRYLMANITRGAPNFTGLHKGTHANYAQYDYALPPFNLRKLAQVAEINREDWTEFALFALS